jgi:hypothetical protein
VYLPAMSLEVALARRSAIVEFTRRIMVKDQDFGQIPGTNKPTLPKPGAEKLCSFFGLEPEFTPVVEDLDWTGAQHGGEVFCYARYRCDKGSAAVSKQRKNEWPNTASKRTRRDRKSTRLPHADSQSAH